jgi:hypothetical protein
MCSTCSGQWCCGGNVYPFTLGEETLLDRCFKPLNPDLDHTPSPTNSRQGKKNSECFSKPLIPSKPLIVEFALCNVYVQCRRTPKRFIYNSSSYDKDWKGFASRLSTWFMMMTACLDCYLRFWKYDVEMASPNKGMSFHLWPMILSLLRWALIMSIYGSTQGALNCLALPVDPAGT